MSYNDRSAKVYLAIVILVLVVCAANPASSSPDSTVEFNLHGLEQIAVHVTAAGDLQTRHQAFTLWRDLVGPATIDLEFSNSGPSLEFVIMLLEKHATSTKMKKHRAPLPKSPRTFAPFHRIHQDESGKFTLTSHPVRWQKGSRDQGPSSNVTLLLYVPATGKQYLIGDLEYITPGPAIMWYLRRLALQIPVPSAIIALALLAAGGAGGFWLAEKRGKRSRATGA